MHPACFKRTKHYLELGNLNWACWTLLLNFFPVCLLRSPLIWEVCPPLPLFQPESSVMWTKVQDREEQFKKCMWWNEKHGEVVLALTLIIAAAPIPWCLVCRLPFEHLPVLNFNAWLYTIWQDQICTLQFSEPASFTFAMKTPCWHYEPIKVEIKVVVPGLSPNSVLPCAGGTVPLSLSLAGRCSSCLVVTVPFSDPELGSSIGHTQTNLTLELTVPD